MNGNVERRVITEEDVRRNDRRTGELSPFILSPEDEPLFRQITRIVRPFEENPRVRFFYQKALEGSS